MAPVEIQWREPSTSLFDVPDNRLYRLLIGAVICLAHSICLLSEFQPGFLNMLRIWPEY